jgi:hypothetical protein
MWASMAALVALLVRSAGWPVLGRRMGAARGLGFKFLVVQDQDLDLVGVGAGTARTGA